MNDLYIVEGHPIKYRGKEIECELLPNHIKNVSKVKLDKMVYVYCLCTANRVFVNIENVPVCTRKETEWEKMIKNQNDILWTKL